MILVGLPEPSLLLVVPVSFLEMLILRAYYSDALVLLNFLGDSRGFIAISVQHCALCWKHIETVLIIILPKDLDPSSRCSHIKIIK